MKAMCLVHGLNATTGWRRLAASVFAETPDCLCCRNCRGFAGPADHRWSLWGGIAAGVAIWLSGTHAG
jgi:hypothetical protein